MGATTDSETITVPGQLRGYPGVAFGGYVAGVLAGRAAAKTVRVDFRRPTPVEVPVGVAGTAADGAVLTGPDGVLSGLGEVGCVPASSGAVHRRAAGSPSVLDVLG